MEVRNGDVLYSNSDLVHLATELGSLTSSPSSTAADLQTGYLLLKELLSSPRLLGSRDISELVLQRLVSAVSNLTAPSHTDQWRAVEGNGSGAGALLQSVESLVRRAAEVVQSTELMDEYASLRTVSGTAAEFNGLQWSVFDGGSVRVPRELVGTGGELCFIHFHTVACCVPLCSFWSGLEYIPTTPGLLLPLPPPHHPRHNCLQSNMGGGHSRWRNKP